MNIKERKYMIIYNAKTVREKIANQVFVVFNAEKKSIEMQWEDFILIDGVTTQELEALKISPSYYQGNAKPVDQVMENLQNQLKQISQDKIVYIVMNPLLLTDYLPKQIAEANPTLPEYKFNMINLREELQKLYTVDFTNHSVQQIVEYIQIKLDFSFNDDEFKKETNLIYQIVKHLCSQGWDLNKTTGPTPNEHLTQQYKEYISLQSQQQSEKISAQQFLQQQQQSQPQGLAEQQSAPQHLLPQILIPQQAEISSQIKSQPPASDGQYQYFVKLRGLPYNVMLHEVMQFVQLPEVLDTDYAFTFDYDGRFLGSAYLRLKTEAQFLHLKAKDQECIGKRYIEVIKATEREWDYESKNQPDDIRCQKDFNLPRFMNDPMSHLGIVRLRGLPYRATNQEIESFMSGLDIAENGIIILLDGRRPSGECFVLFKKKFDAIRSLDKNNGKMGERYIDVFLSNTKEFRRLQDHNFVLKPFKKKHRKSRSRDSYSSGSSGGHRQGHGYQRKGRDYYQGRRGDRYQRDYHGDSRSYRPEHGGYDSHYGSQRGYQYKNYQGSNYQYQQQQYLPTSQLYQGGFGDQQQLFHGQNPLLQPNILTAQIIPNGQVQPTTVTQQLSNQLLYPFYQQQQLNQYTNTLQQMGQKSPFGDYLSQSSVSQIKSNNPSLK